MANSQEAKKQLEDTNPSQLTKVFQVLDKCFYTFALHSLPYIAQTLVVIASDEKKTLNLPTHIVLLARSFLSIGQNPLPGC